MNAYVKCNQSEQDYLESILTLGREQNVVHRIDVAKKLGVSQAAVNKAVKLLCEKESVIVAIDGRCASGKTTLASLLGSTVDCNIVHADSFFLLPHHSIILPQL